VPLVWVVRTRADPHALSAPIQMALRDATGGLPVARIRSMDEVVVQSTARADFNMLLLTVFGFAALLLAAIGVYGLMSYSVEQRTQEIGIRLALGAGLNQVRNMVIVQGMGLAAAGVAIGTASVFGLARLVESLLFGVTARDPIVFVAVPAALSAVASLAVWLPALRATRIRIWNEEFGIWNSRRIPNSKFLIHQPSSRWRPRPRSVFTSLRCRFDSSRFSFAARFGFVGRRVLGRLAACCSKATSRARAASRFCPCVRCSRLSMRSTPSDVMRLPASLTSRSLTSMGSEEAFTSKRSSTAVETLLTFWPPGPDARTNRSSISRSSMAMLSVIRITSSPADNRTD